MNKHEIAAWWRFSLSGVYGAYLVWVLFFASQKAINTAFYYFGLTTLIFFALLWLSASYVKRRKGVDQDERDRAISMTANLIALLALLVIVGATPLVLFEIILGMEETVTFHIDWAYFYFNACTTFAIWLEAAITVFHHWRDRR